MFSVLVIRLRSLRLLRVSGIVMRLRMFLLLITFLKASHSFRNRLLVICKNAYLFATMIMTSVSSPFSCCSGIVSKHLFQGYLNIYNNYFKAPWMPDRTEANPNELNQDDARYGFRCCHLKNIWTAPLPPETELSRQMTTSTTSIDIMGLQAAYANLHTDQ